MKNIFDPKVIAILFSGILAGGSGMFALVKNTGYAQGKSQK